VRAVLLSHELEIPIGDGSIKCNWHIKTNPSKSRIINMSSTTTTTALSGATQTVAPHDHTEALKVATARFVEANPKSKEVFENASKHLPAGNTRTTLFAPPFPVSVVSGSGCEIVSADGRTYLDMLGEYTAGIYGHSHPKIIEALQYGLTKGVNFGATGPLEGELAGMIKERFEGAGLEMLRFTNSGTESNVLAIATAKAWTGRSKVLVFSNSYHGSVLSFGKVEPTNMPGEFLIAQYNSIPSVERILSQLEPDSLAAILLEPMQGAGGSFPASKKFLQYLRDQATKLGALLIHDEVMTSRLYYAGGLSGRYGIKPDMITMGKYLGGGMSFGLFGGRKEIMSLFDPRAGGSVRSNPGGKAATMMLTHSGTFNNNVMTMHAGIAGAKILSPKVLEDLNALGDYLRHTVNEMLARHGIISANSTESDNEPDIAKVPRGKLWMSGIGSINSLHFGRNDELPELRDLFYFHLLENGIYYSRRGFIALNICHTKADMDRFVEVMEMFVKQWEEFLRT
jgi:glutamate-1-semialdehyde 2,1-aminomutase